MSAKDRHGQNLRVGDRIVLYHDLYKIEAIDDCSDDQSALLHLVEVGRLLSMVRPNRTTALARNVKFYAHWEDT